MSSKFNAFKSWLINNFLSIISLISPFITAAILGICRFFEKNFTLLDIVLLVIIAIQSIFFITFSLWRSISYKSYHYPTHKIKSEFIVMEKIVNYVVEEKNITPKGQQKPRKDFILHFSNKREIKCCADHLQTLPGKYLWTGSKDASLPIQRAHMQIKEIEAKKGFWTMYNIVLDDCMLKGDVRTINNAFPDISDCKSSRPFVASSTEEPTKALTFNIDLGKDYSNKSVVVETFRSSDSFYPLTSEKFCFDEDGKFTYTKNKPKRFRYYVISWNW